MTTLMLGIRLASFPIRIGHSRSLVAISLSGGRGIAPLASVGVIEDLILDYLHDLIELIHGLVECAVVKAKHWIDMLLIDKIIHQLQLPVGDQIIANNRIKTVLQLRADDSSLNKLIRTSPLLTKLLKRYRLRWCSSLYDLA